MIIIQNNWSELNKNNNETPASKNLLNFLNNINFRSNYKITCMEYKYVLFLNKEFVSIFWI